MGKKHKHDSNDEFEKIADHLEEYLDAVSTLVIISDKPKKKIKKAKKVVREAIDNLRKGNISEVIDEKAYDEYMSSRDNMLG
ncbi:hypothetical protein IKN40_04160 [bacterium]|nr:hypothetical protein [bacterium]